MNIALTGPTNPLLLDGALCLLERTPTPPPDPSAPIRPAASLAGHWDASTLANLTNGGPVSSWGAAVTGITDSSAAGKNAGTSAKGIARQAGLLGGLYDEGGVGNYTVLHPVINDYSVGANAISVGPGQTFSIYLVWSRPNVRQTSGGSLDHTAVSLIKINGVSVLGMTGNGDGADTMTLFPAGTPVNAGTLEVRHTHCARLVFNGSAVDVWLDGAKIIAGAANQMTLGATANLAFLDAAQCIFHEAAAWSKALSGSENADLSGYAAKWPLGRRRAANGVIIGQSNAANLLGSFVLWPQLNKLVSYWTGCISSNLLWGPGGTLTGGATTFSGQGLYDASGGLFLNSASGAGSVASWPLGANGNAFLASLDSMSADEAANFRYIAWYWSESDSASLTYAQKATYTAAMKRAFALIRSHVGKTAAQLPILVINALPFTPGAEGCQTHRECMADLVADATQNCHIMLAQSDDALGQGDSWDAGTGLESGAGNGAHREAQDVSLYLRRWAPPIARAVVDANAANGTPDVLTAIDASIPITCGPRIAAAQYEGTAHASSGSVLVTVEHDGGSDLLLPLRAALGVGWTLMDGVSSSAAGTPGAPGTLIAAIACAYVSPTQLRVTLASQPAHASTAQLYYCYGTGLDANNYAIIGRGNAVTDNFAAATLTAGWQIGLDQGSAAQPNNPLQATLYGIALS